MSSTSSAGVWEAAVYQVGKNIERANRDVAGVSAVGAAEVQRGPGTVQACVGLSAGCAACHTAPSPALTGVFALGTLEASVQTERKRKTVLPRP